MLAITYVSDLQIISTQPRMMTINSCIKMDLTGQMCSNSLGCKMYFGFGGQLNFLRGAAISHRGKAINAFPSVTSKGENKIQPVLKFGAGVVVTRADAHYIVTEHEIADLFGKTLRQRPNAFIQTAHPDYRECFEKFAFDRLKSNPTKYVMLM